MDQQKPDRKRCGDLVERASLLEITLYLSKFEKGWELNGLFYFYLRIGGDMERYKTSQIDGNLLINSLYNDVVRFIIHIHIWSDIPKQDNHLWTCFPFIDCKFIIYVGYILHCMECTYYLKHAYYPYIYIIQCKWGNAKKLFFFITHAFPSGMF